jgi:hypothetical protein
VAKISLTYFKINVLVVSHGRASEGSNGRASEGSKSFGEKYMDKRLSFSLVSP